MAEPLVLFFVLAFLLSWLFFVPLVIWHLPFEWGYPAGFGPAIAALITHRLSTGSFRAFRIAVSWRRTLAGTAAGIGLTLAAFVILPSVAASDPRNLEWRALASLGVYHYSTLLGGPLGEEPGWRGYALPRLEARLGPVPASLVLALLWTGWHVPMFWYPGWTSLPFWMFTLMLVAETIILTYVANVAAFGVVAAIATHAAFNTSPGFLAGLFAHTDPRGPIPFQTLFILGGLVVALVLAIATRGRLGYRSSSA